MNNLNLKNQEPIYLKINRIVTLIIFSIIFVAVTTILFLSPAPLWLMLIIDTVILLIATLVYLYQGAAYKRFSYAMNDYGLYINQGVIWQRKIIVPRNRVQHTDVAQGPLMRKYELAELTVHTAGTRNASVKLLGIKHDLAEQLRESLAFEESNDAV
jgi:membrane protein YdbS with pleckstrin-like domain